MGTKGPNWLETAVFYEIYPQSFYDTNGDGIGDIEGIIRKLEYVKDLGCNAIWINPCFESPFRDAGYDVSDYYKIAPRYGTNEDMARLTQKAHALGIKVCLDFVPGHTSIDHPWFKESCKPERNKFSNWYIWTSSVWEDSGNQNLKAISGFADRDGQYITNFFYSQPALNYGFENKDPSKPWQLPTNHPDVLALRREMTNVMRFWLDIGVDGFRVDMAGSLVKEDPDYIGTMAFWRGIREMFDREYPEAVLISEWSCPEKAISAGFHTDFLLQFAVPPIYNALLRKENCFFSSEGCGDINEFLVPYMEMYNAIKPKGYISIPSGNHDVARISRGRTTDEIELVFAFILTMPGVPFIYYGDEIGMRFDEKVKSKEGGYFRTGARTPMQWDSRENAGFSESDSDRLYLPVDESEDRPTAEKQWNDPLSLLNRIKRLINLRLSTPCLCAEGLFESLYAKNGEYPLVYLREYDSEKYVIAINPSANPSETVIDLITSGKTELKLGRGVSLETTGKGCLLCMQGKSYGIFKI